MHCNIFTRDVFPHESACLLCPRKVFFSVLVGATTAGQAAPYIEIFSMARGAAAVIFATIDARPDIDVDAEGGEEPGRGCGRIEFRDVHFSYPSRRSVEVRGLSYSMTSSQKGGRVKIPQICGLTVHKYCGQRG